MNTKVKVFSFNELSNKKNHACEDMHRVVSSADVFLSTVPEVYTSFSPNTSAENRMPFHEHSNTEALQPEPDRYIRHCQAAW
jgi:hypothetical protein